MAMEMMEGIYHQVCRMGEQAAIKESEASQFTLWLPSILRL